MGTVFIESYAGIGTNVVSALDFKGWLEGYRPGTAIEVGRFGAGSACVKFAHNVMFHVKNFGVNCGVVWVGLAFKRTTSSLGHVCLRKDGQYQLRIDFNTNGTVQVYTGNGASSLATGTTVLAADTWYYIEFYACIHATTGAFQLRINGSPEITLSNVNTAGAGGTSVNQLGISSGNNTIVYFTDIYCVDNTDGIQGFQGDSHFYAYSPASDGAVKQWNTSSGTDHYPLVSEASHDGDTSYVYSSTVDHIDLYGGINLPANIGPILSIQKTSFARKDDVGTRSLQGVIKSGAVTAGMNRKFILTNSFACCHDNIEKDPETNAAWTQTKANAAQFGPKVYA